MSPCVGGAMVWIRNFQDQFDQFSKTTRLNTLRSICFLGAGFAILNFIVKAFYFKRINLDLATILITAFFLMSLGVWLSKTENILTGARVINIVSFLFIPLRIYQTGGIYSPVLYLYVFHCAFLVTIYGREAGMKMLYWSLFSVLCFGFAGSGPDLIPVAPFYENPIMNGIGHVMVLLMTTLFIVQLGKESSMVSSFLRDLEKKHNIYSIMREYTVKTTPAISNALKTLDQEKKEHNMRPFSK